MEMVLLVVITETVAEITVELVDQQVLLLFQGMLQEVLEVLHLDLGHQDQRELEVPVVVVDLLK